MVPKALFEESEQLDACTANTISTTRSGVFYATRKIKLKNKYKRNSACGAADCVCRRFSIAHFFFFF